MLNCVNEIPRSGCFISFYFLSVDVLSIGLRVVQI